MSTLTTNTEKREEQKMQTWQFILQDGVIISVTAPTYREAVAIARGN